MHQTTGFFRRVRPASPANRIEFHQIKAALAQFQTTDQAAFPTQFVRQLTLRKTRFGPQANNQLANAFALPGMNGFVHARILRAQLACFQNAGRQTWRRLSPSNLMSRRNQSLPEVLIKFPWPVSAVAAVFVPAFMRWGFPLLWQGNPMFQPLATLAASLALLAVLFFGFMAFLSFLSAKKQRTLVDRQTSVESIRELPWKEFEFMVAGAYRLQGYAVDFSFGKGADGGVDLVLRKAGRVSLVQCKQWKVFSVGAPVVREQFGIMTAERADEVIIVTSGKFTREAETFAQGKPIKLVDGPRLLELVKQVQGCPPSVSPSPTGKPATSPACPKCGKEMILKLARRGPNAGNQFWGCRDFPACKG
jgi:restriction system protein